MKEQHAPALLAILKDMMVRRYDAERITHYGRSRATLDATERCDQASIHPRHDHRFRRKNQVVVLWIRFSKLAFKGTKQTLYSAHEKATTE